MKELLTFAGTYQQLLTYSLSLKSTNLHCFIEIKKDCAATEHAISQIKIFMHIEETAHNLAVCEHVSFSVIFAGTYLSADCCNLEGFQWTILQNTGHMLQ